MGDQVQVMPEVNAMVLNNYSKREWLQYYKNVWVRNCMARAIDVQTDIILKEKNPESTVQLEDERPAPVKVRLEMRKIALQDGLNLVAGIDTLMAKSEEELEAFFTEKALAVAEDMKPVEEKKTDGDIEPKQAEPVAPEEVPTEAPSDEAKV